MDEHSCRHLPIDTKIDLTNFIINKTKHLAFFRMSFFVIGGIK